MTTRLVVVCILALVACKKADPTPAAGSAAPNAGSGSAVAAFDPWNGPPAGGDTKLGDKTKAIAVVDQTKTAPVADLAKKVDVAQIAKATSRAEISGFGAVKESGFRVVYNPSPVAAHEQYREIFEKNHVFESVAEGLNQTVRLPTTVDINTVDCNTVNAFYDPSSKRIIVCYELLDYFLDAFKGHITDQNALSNAVMGAVMFSFFHEAGHGLIDILDLAAVGREEDSVDQLATLILIAAGDQGIAMALSGAHYFKVQQDSGHSMPFSDEHAFDGQRFYNINCLIYGSNPEKYAAFVAQGNLTAERARRCPDEFRKINKAWEHLLQPFMTNGAATNINYKPSVPTTEAPKNTKSDPWDDDGTATPATPVEPTPGTPEATPEQPTATAAHAITCEQVAMQALVLIADAAKEKAKTMTAEQVDDLKRRLQAELPATAQQIIAKCAKDDWSDALRTCISNAATLDAATACK